MQNGQLNQSGALSSIINGVGTFDGFRDMASRRGISVVETPPGVDVDVEVV